MAQSRLEKIGTIFSRASGLLRAGAVKPVDKPIWYDVYAAFPPKVEPRFDRPVPNVQLRNIFYEEDVVRAKYHKSTKFSETINLSDTRRETNTQQFIGIYNHLKSQGPLDEEKLMEVAKDMLDEKIKNRYPQQAKEENVPLLENFSEATKLQQQSASVDIKDLFKD